MTRNSESQPAATQSSPLKAGREHNLYWADPHGGQVALAAKIPDFFRYARDVAALDFVGYQRNDHMISAEDWRLQQEAEAAFSDPGRFVPLPGFEWSPETGRGGHHNVYFRRYNQPIRRNSHAQVTDKSDIATDLPHVTDLYAAYRHRDVLITPHVGGAHADLSYHEPSIEPAIEITSTHGSFEWFLEEAAAESLYGRLCRWQRQSYREAGDGHSWLSAPSLCPSRANRYLCYRPYAGSLL